MKAFSVVAALCLTAGLLHAAPVPSVDDLTLREQTGQTIMPRVLIGQQEAFKEAVLNGEVTGFFIKAGEGLVTFPSLNSKNQARFTAKQYKRLQKTIADLNKWAAQSRHKIPLIFALDYEGGTVTSPMYMGLKQMPSNMLLAASGQEDVVAQMYAAQALEIKKSGSNMALGPDTDVNSNPNNPIINARSFGDDTARVGAYSLAAVKALQQNGVPATNKHFPGHGDTAVDSHKSQPVTDLPEQELWNTHIAAFEPSVKEADAFLSAHVVYPALDADNSASFSPKILKDLLRGKMGYKGIIITDGLDMGAVSDVPVESIILRSYKAGNNVLLLAGDVKNIEQARQYPHIAAGFVQKSVAGVEDEGLDPDSHVTRAEIRSSAQKVLDLKKKMGLFDPAPAVKETGYKAAALRAAREGVTLVRSAQENAVIPLKRCQTRPDGKTACGKRNVCSVFFADGIFSLQLKAFNKTLKKGGMKVRSVQAPFSAQEKDRQAALACLAEADALVIGTSGGRVMNPNQTAYVQELLGKAKEQGKPAALISLLNPYEISAYPQADTVLAVYGATKESMEVAAQILLGDAPAKGKLPVKLP